jgi:hypothetical protein
MGRHRLYMVVVCLAVASCGPSKQSQLAQCYLEALRVYAHLYRSNLEEPNFTTRNFTENCMTADDLNFSKDCSFTALRLNQRPRKTLGFETPADKLQAVLH